MFNTKRRAIKLFMNWRMSMSIPLLSFLLQAHLFWNDWRLPRQEDHQDLDLRAMIELRSRQLWSKEQDSTCLLKCLGRFYQSYQCLGDRSLFRREPLEVPLDTRLARTTQRRKVRLHMVFHLVLGSLRGNVWSYVHQESRRYQRLDQWWVFLSPM